MTGYDPKVPLTLKLLQEWFASAIVQPLQANNPSKQTAERYIKSTVNLKAEERIELYNDQYWWRLLKNLHEMFPILVRLFGYDTFNSLFGIPYLVKYPPSCWNLNNIAKKLPRWILEEYSNKDDKELIFHAADLDWIFNYSFVCIDYPSISSENVGSDQMGEFVKKTLYLQPHVNMCSWEFDLFNFRVDLLKQEPEYWIDHPLPELKKGKFFYAFYRNSRNNIGWKEMEKEEYTILNLFKSGSSLEEACEYLEQFEDEAFEKAFKNIHFWFQEWAFKKWLTLHYHDESARSGLFSAP